MKERKNSLNNIKEVDPKKHEEVQIEKQLLPRLKFMGLLLFFFSGCALCYSIFFAAGMEPDLAQALANDGLTPQQDIPYASGLTVDANASFDLFQDERFNAYVVTFFFAIVGVACLFVAWSKQKKLIEK